MTTALRVLAFVVGVSLAAATGSAQIRLGEIGFELSGPSGSAGDPCWGHSCTAHQVTVSSGDTVTLKVHAPPLAPYVIFASPGSSSCISIPGVTNALVLDPPIIVPMYYGICSQFLPALRCHLGYSVDTVAVPRLPPGLTVSLQAVAQSLTADGLGWVMSSAIEVTVK